MLRTACWLRRWSSHVVAREQNAGQTHSETAQSEIEMAADCLNRDGIPQRRRQADWWPTSTTLNRAGPCRRDELAGRAAEQGRPRARAAPRGTGPRSSVTLASVSRPPRVNRLIRPGEDVVAASNRRRARAPGARSWLTRSPDLVLTEEPAGVVEDLPWSARQAGLEVAAMSGSCRIGPGPSRSARVTITSAIRSSPWYSPGAAGIFGSHGSDVPGRRHLPRRRGGGPGRRADDRDRRRAGPIHHGEEEARDRWRRGSQLAAAAR